MIKPKNYKFSPNADEKYVTVFSKYFEKECITLGSLCRKLPFLLMELADINGAQWFLKVQLDEARSRFLTKIACDEFDFCTIENSSETHGTKIANSLHVLNELFDNDKKVIRTPCSYGIAEFVYQKNKYRYEKIRYNDNYMFVFQVKPLNGFIEKIKKFFRTAKEGITNIKLIKVDGAPVVAKYK